jgi:YVTN family beta-propeller protein
MLRVSPDGSAVWVQTGGTNMNVVLDATSMEQLNAAPAGIDPEHSAFQPGGPYGMIAHIASNALVVLNAATGDPVTTIPLGKSQGSISYSPDGALAYVSSFTGNQVYVVDMQRLAVVRSIPTGPAPLGLVLLDRTQLAGAK